MQHTRCSERSSLGKLSRPTASRPHRLASVLVAREHEGSQTLRLLLRVDPCIVGGARKLAGTWLLKNQTLTV